MNNRTENNHRVQVVAALIIAIGTMAVCGVPVVGRLLDIYFPMPQTSVNTPVKQVTEAARITEIAPSSTVTPQPDCWQTAWAFNPSSEKDITLSLSSARVGYKAYFDSEVYADNPGSLRLETTKVVKDPMQDQNAWTWMDNLQLIPANDGLYRVIAMIKTQDVVASHISVVGRNKSGKDIFNGNTNQIAVVPVVSRALYGSNDWQPYSSSEFNPKEWSDEVMYIAIGINAGWSPDGQPSITWFDNVQLQYCIR